jgi:periplasmic protein TonB
MTRDIIIGIVISASFHFGFYYSGTKPTVKKEVTKEDKAVIQVIELPPVEPEEPILVDDSPPTPQEIVMAPPSMADLIGTVTPDSFVQALQPPPPPNLGAPTSMAIPPGRPVAGNVGKGFDQIFDIKDLDQQPAPTFRPSPDYPYEMRRNGITGEVVVIIVSNANGDVVDAFIKSSTHREFEEPARRAVLKWKFRPGKKGGRNVSSRMSQALTFGTPE